MHSSKLHPMLSWCFRLGNLTLTGASSHSVFISRINAASVSLSPWDSVGCNPSPAERILNLPIHSRSPGDTRAHFPWIWILCMPKYLCITWNDVCTTKLLNTCSLLKIASSWMLDVYLEIVFIWKKNTSIQKHGTTSPCTFLHLCLTQSKTQSIWSFFASSWFSF